MLKKIIIFVFSLLFFVPFNVAAQDSTNNGGFWDIQGPVYMCLKVNGLEGESSVDGHQGEIDVLSWEWELSQSGTTHVGTGSGSGKPTVEDLVIKKYVDKASPGLLLGCLNGTHFPEATLTIGNGYYDYLVITMYPVMVTSAMSAGKQDYGPVVESISLNFGKVNFSYTPMTPEGQPGTAVYFEWDIAANREIYLSK